MNASSKTLLFVFRTPPYGNSLSREGLDAVLASAVFDQSIQLLFLGDGVWQLLKAQQTASIAAKNQQKMLSALPLYGVDDIYIDEQALADRNINEEGLCLQAQRIDCSGIAKLMNNANTIFTF